MALSASSNLIGRLSGGERINGRLSGGEQLNGSMTVPERVNSNIYDGDYTVTPIFENMILETNGKLMLDDVSVLKIPVEITTNITGGKTVYIGGDM